MQKHADPKYNNSIADEGRKQGFYNPSTRPSRARDLEKFERELVEGAKPEPTVTDKKIEEIKQEAKKRKHQRSVRNRAIAGVAGATAVVSLAVPTTRDLAVDIAETAVETVKGGADRIHDGLFGPDDHQAHIDIEDASHPAQAITVHLPENK